MAITICRMFFGPMKFMDLFILLVRILWVTEFFTFNGLFQFNSLKNSKEKLLDLIFGTTPIIEPMNHY